MVPVIESSGCGNIEMKIYIKCSDSPIAEQRSGQVIYRRGQTTRLSCLVKPKSLYITFGL
jgi:hypothetical protein